MASERSPLINGLLLVVYHGPCARQRMRMVQWACASRPCPPSPKIDATVLGPVKGMLASHSLRFAGGVGPRSSQRGRRPLACFATLAGAEDVGGQDGDLPLGRGWMEGMVNWVDNREAFD